MALSYTKALNFTISYMLRRLRQRSIRLVFVVGSLTYLFTLLLVYSDLDSQLEGTVAVKWIKPIFDPFEIITSRRCSVRLPLPLALPKSSVHQYTPKSLASDVCYIPQDHDVDIQMDKEWARIGVGYPQMVLSVYGWVDTIQVESWSMEPLHVIVVPFSHQDPGWKSTYDSYYESLSKPTLSLIVSQLTKNPNRRFVWSEIVFLERWWNNAAQHQRSDMKRLLDSGQLEILGGGWVMPDEASTHYATILDQMMEGHLWLAETLGLNVNTSWAIDPFGHSSTLAYLNREAGIKNMLIQRTHFAVKRHFAKNKYLEFFWKQSWNDRSIFCHMMPFLLYSIPHSCGPDRHVCCQFDFHKSHCFKGKKKVAPVKITAENLPKLANDLWSQLRKKSELYQSDVVLMPHGDDFRYNTESEWNDQFNNLDKLMDYINDRPDMNMKIEYGTLSDYFNKIPKSRTGPKYQKYPSLSGDFFPYSDRADQYWSGHYTSRPFHKRLARILQSKLRSTEIMFTLAQARNSLSTQNTTMLYENITSVRRALALFQHHDAITGTSKKHVVADYANLMHKALLQLHRIQMDLLKTTLLVNQSMEATVESTDVWLNVNDPPGKRVIDVKHTKYLIVHNPLFHSSHKVVIIHVNSVYVTVSTSGKPVRIQIAPVFDDNNIVKEQAFVLSLEVDLPPMSTVVYELKPSESIDKSSLATVIVYRRQDSNWFRHLGPFKVSLSAEEEIILSNINITARVSVCDGMLKYVRQSGYVYKADAHFVVYTTGTTYNPLRDKSGAYIFLPDGPAKEWTADPTAVMKISGNLYNQVRTVYNDVTHLITVFNISGSDGSGISLENQVNIGNSRWDNTELVLRLETDIIAAEHQFCTDSNGFQMQRRTTRRKLGLQGNFYPVTTSVFLDDRDRRLTVLTTESHGVASLASGMLDIVLDRRLIQDDWRGLNEGVTDNRPTQSNFFLLFERKHYIQNEATTSCYLSVRATAVTRSLNNPPNTFITSTAKPPLVYILKKPNLPCSFGVVNLRLMKAHDGQPFKEALLVLHRAATDCSFSRLDMTCVGKMVSIKSLLPFMDVVSVKEMTISGVQELREINIESDIDIPPMEIKTYKIAFR